MWSSGVPNGRVMDCTWAIPGVWKTALATLLQEDHVGRIPQIVIGLDHQQFGIQPRLEKVPLGGGVTDIGRRAVRHVAPDVVTGLVSRQGEQTHEGDRHVTTRTAPGQRTMAVPIRRHPRSCSPRLGSNRPKRLPMISTAGARVSAATNATRMPIAAGMPRLLKIRQSG